jgi:putative transcriptional regulator
MIRLKLDEMLREKNITAYALHIKSGLHQSVISKIKRNMSKALQLDVLDTLCKALDCQPGELIAYENESATQGVNTQIVNTTQIVERATQNVKQSAPLNGFEAVKAEKKQLRLKEKSERESGKVFNNSILEIVNSSSDNELLSTVAVAERLNVSRKSVNDYIISDKLRAVKGKGNHNFIRESDLLEFIAQRGKD